MYTLRSKFQSSLDVSLGTREGEVGLLNPVLESFNRPWTSLLVLARCWWLPRFSLLSVSIVLGRLSWYSPAILLATVNGFFSFQSSLDVSLGTRGSIHIAKDVNNIGFNRPWTSLLVLAGELRVEVMALMSVSIVLGRLSWYSRSAVMVVLLLLLCFNRPWTSLLVLAGGTH